MPEKLPEFWLPIITAAWGGVVAYIRQVQAGKKFHPISMLLHLTVSGFAGMMFWLLAQEYNVSGERTAFVTGMAGFLGSEAIKLLEDKYKQWTQGLR